MINSGKPQLNYDNRFLDISVKATNKFAALDRIMFRWSPYLTQQESYRILDTMELWANSNYEGNFTEADNYEYLKRTLGQERFDLICLMENIDNQKAALSFNGDNQL